MFPKIEVSDDAKEEDNYDSALGNLASSYAEALDSVASSYSDLYNSILGSSSSDSSSNDIPSWAQGKWKGQYDNQNAKVTVTKEDIKITANNKMLSVSNLLNTTKNAYSVYGVAVDVEYVDIDENTFEIQILSGGVGTIFLRLKIINSRKVLLEMPSSDLSIELNKN